MIAPTGFREYDARWAFPDAINLPGIQALGFGLGTQIHEAGLKPQCIVCNDYRSYQLSVKQALTIGLMQAGIEVLDIGVGLSPVAYFAQFHLGVDAVAMCTASHNPNGWTGVKMGIDKPLTHGPEEMARLRDIVLNGEQVARPGGAGGRGGWVEEAYIDHNSGDIEKYPKRKGLCAPRHRAPG
ncbi:MAG: phosphomannomutase/phosphoglucomutase, partial [Chloroflexota bacterium]